MVTSIQDRLIRFLRWTERYTKTDMVYLMKAGWWLNLGVIITAVLSLVLSIAYANILPPAVYGYYQYLLSISGLVASISLPGMNTAVAQSVARGYEGDLRASIKAQLLWAPIPLLACLAGALYYFLHSNTDIGIGLVAVAILTPLVNVFNTYSGFLEGKRAFRRYFYLNSVITVGSYGSILLAIIFFKDAAVLIFVNLGINLILTIYAYLRTITLCTPNTDTDAATIPYGRHLSAINAVGMLNQVDSLLVFHFLGPINLAVYSFATILPERAASFMNFIGIASLPRFAMQPASSIRKTLLGKILRLALLGIGAAAVYALAAPFIFKFLFPRYLLSVRYTQEYAIIIALIAVTALINSVLSAKRFTREIYVIGLAQPILLILLQVPLLFLYGITGMVVAQVITSTVTILLSLGLFFWPLHIEPTEGTDIAETEF